MYKYRCFRICLYGPRGGEDDRINYYNNYKLIWKAGGRTGTRHVSERKNDRVLIGSPRFYRNNIIVISLSTRPPPASIRSYTYIYIYIYLYWGILHVRPVVWAFVRFLTAAADT